MNAFGSLDDMLAGRDDARAPRRSGRHLRMSLDIADEMGAGAAASRSNRRRHCRLPARGGLDRLDIEEFAGRSKRALEALCRARAQSVYLGGNEALCRILGRYKLYVDTRDKGLCAHLLLDGYWEMGLTMHIAAHVRAGMTAIDVGANFGYYTILLGALVGEGGHVLAIEPAPETAAMLRRSVALNGFEGFTTVIEAAAGAGEAPNGCSRAAARAEKAQIVASPDVSTIFRRHVAPGRGIASIDALAADQRRIDFIKIDAEGAEEAVIAGALATLAARQAASGARIQRRPRARPRPRCSQLWARSTADRDISTCRATCCETTAASG